MSIPLDRLYHYIEDCVSRIYKEDVIIYRFYPHGSKKIQDLQPLRLNSTDKSQYYRIKNLAPEIFCNDQEPLNFELYDDPAKVMPIVQQYLDMVRHGNRFAFYNFRGPIQNIWDRALLLHSEKRSRQTELYVRCQFIPVYYWSHAVIALDWFRYAQHVAQRKHRKKTFLIYNRAWSGTREYRLKFSDLLIQNNLQHHCQTNFDPDDELGVHYSTYQFRNPTWAPDRVIENFVPVKKVPSTYSADFCLEDYENTDLEIVLETLFDDSRLHLTEKTLRPIACAQPFVLAASHGSLEYLRSYGFKTFDSCWDESYDKIEDPYRRLLAVIDLMTQIATWDEPTKIQKLQQAQIIADYNKQHFFSQAFFELVDGELHQNLQQAFEELETTNLALGFFKRYSANMKDPHYLSVIDSVRQREDADYVIERAKRYFQRSIPAVN